MQLTKEQQAILDGEKGETLAKVMKTLGCTAVPLRPRSLYLSHRSIIIS